MPQRPKPAQHGRDQHPRQRAIAVGELGQTRMCRRAVELLVKRTAAAQHAIENVGSDAPRGETGGFGRYGGGIGHRR